MKIAVAVNTQLYDIVHVGLPDNCSEFAVSRIEDWSYREHVESSAKVEYYRSRAVTVGLFLCELYGRNDLSTRWRQHTLRLAVISRRTQ